MQEAHADHQQTEAPVALCSAESTHEAARHPGEEAARELPAARAAAHQAQLDAETLRTAASPLQAQVWASHDVPASKISYRDGLQVTEASVHDSVSDCIWNIPAVLKFWWNCA